MTRDSDIDEVYDIIDDLMQEGNLRAIDFIIKHVNLNSWGQSRDKLDLALSFLTATLPVKNRLKERGRLIDFVKSRAPICEIDELLSGLT